VHKISELMSTHMVYIGPEHTVIEAVKSMRENKIGAILIKDGEDTLGIFTERDLMTRLHLDDPAQLAVTKIKEIMTTELKTVDHDESNVDVLNLMREMKIRHLPVSENGKITGIVSLRDLAMHYEETLQQLVEEKEAKLIEAFNQLKESEGLFRTIFENSAVGITLTDKNEKIIANNSFINHLLDMEEADLLNKPVKDLYLPEEWKRIRSLDIRKLGMKSRLETQILNKAKELIDVEVSISVLKNAKGEVTGSIGIIEDIRERKAADNMKSEFISSVSHELRTPLAISREALSLALRGKVGEITEKQMEILSMANKNLDRLAYLINDILDLAKIEAGKMDLIKESLSMGDIVKECCEGWNLKATSKELNIKCEIPESPLTASVDKTRILQVLSNLINNAIKFTPAGGEITVYVEEKETEIKVSVKDTGPGIAEADLIKLFEKFQQLKRPSGPGAKGTGLGLSIVKSLIELHGGCVGVDTKVGEGCNFFFTVSKT